MFQQVCSRRSFAFSFTFDHARDLPRGQRGYVFDDEFGAQYSSSLTAIGKYVMVDKGALVATTSEYFDASLFRHRHRGLIE